MIGLRSHARDAELAARAGDWRVPSERELLLELVARELAPRALPVAAQWTFARWKPRTALTLAHEVRFEDGTGATVVTKLHAGAKLGAPRPYAVGERALRPFAVVAPERLTLCDFPYDRELPRARALLDLRRLARHVDDLECSCPAACDLARRSSRCCATSPSGARCCASICGCARPRIRRVTRRA